MVQAQAELARRGGRRSGATRLLRRADGSLQVRSNASGAIDHTAEQRFLTALAATANVRLAARAAGFSHASFYHRKRRDPDFAQQWLLALQRGYEQLEAALLAGWKAEDQTAWQSNAPPPLPPMTVNQALQLLYLHQKEARLWTEPEPLRRRRGESHEARVMRLTLLYEAREEHQRERFRQAQAKRLARCTTSPAATASPPVDLPDLAQVTGWSKASGAEPHDPDRALFGGWRLKSGRQDTGE